MINKILWVFFCSILIHACASPINSSHTQSTTKQSGPIVFLDTSGFDHALSRQLSTNEAMVKVDVPSSFSLNQVPDRMAKWLAQVQENGGTIKAKKMVDPNDPTATRSMLAMVIDLTFSVVKEIKERAMFAPADQYDVLLKYKGNGEVKEVVFVRR